jgi:hypothetical protein
MTSMKIAVVRIVAGRWKFKAGRRKFIDCCAVRPCLWSEIGTHVARVCPSRDSGCGSAAHRRGMKVAR